MFTFDEPQVDSQSVAEPWRCFHCKRLMYNVMWVNGKQLPAAGAPVPHHLIGVSEPVCSVCHSMTRVFYETSPGYWAGVNDAKRRAKAEKRVDDDYASYT